MLTEFLGLVLISLVLVFQDHLLLSVGDAVDARGLLLVEDLGNISVVCWLGAAKCVSMRARRYRLAFSRGPASLSAMYDVLLVVERRKRVGSGATWAM
jgi:hypothetical protein